GDPGHFGLLRTLRAQGLATVCWPSVSCLQRISALIQRPWDDVTVVSARGRDFGAAVNVCRARRAVAVLTAPGAGRPSWPRSWPGGAEPWSCSRTSAGRRR